MRFEGGAAAVIAAVVVSTCGGALLQASAATDRAQAADWVYRNGAVYTVDAADSVQQAVAIRDGRIVYVGANDGAAAYVGARTRVTDLQGRMMMPGLVDGHMHPLHGGATLLKCNLNYEQLRVQDLQARIQGCLDRTRDREPDGWLEVVNWFQEAMLPAGTVTNHAVLDVLHTRRPILVTSSFGHTALVNSRALDLAKLDRSTKDPLAGRIAHDATGNPTGILEDAAQEIVARVLPPPTPQDDVRSARASLSAMAKQGITSFMDAAAEPPSLAAYAAVSQAGGLTARAHFAVLVTPAEGVDAPAAVARVLALRKRYDSGPLHTAPAITVRNVKLFLDGVISAPALTGAMLEPYLMPAGGAAGAPWVPSNSRGPDVYFPAATLRALLLQLAQAGIDPHMHADGDRAVREGLDGVAALRAAFPGDEIRPGMAHDEIVDPADYPRFKQLNVTPVLSFQWEKPAPDTVDSARDYLGPARFRTIEPAGALAEAGARIAYGSDWPVDTLNEWFALKVGVTRANSPQAGPQYAGRLAADKGLTRAQVLRAITLNASYELHQDTDTGSIEAGKFADLIVLDRNALTIPAEQIADVAVLQTVVGGKIVYDALR